MGIKTGNAFLLLHQWCKQTQNILKQMHQEIAAAAFLLDRAASLQCSEKILLDVMDGGAAE